MDNLFLSAGFGGQVESPGRVYARLDQINTRAGKIRWLLDCIEADWFDAFATSADGDLARNFQASWRKAPIFVVEAELTALAKASPELAQTLRGYAPAGPQWLAMTLASSGDESLYANIFVEPQRVSIPSLSLVSTQQAKALSAAFSLKPFRASRQSVLNALSRVGTVDFVVTYDVGQGSANGLCDAAGVPMMYADLGGGVLGHVNTFPSQLLIGFCYCTSPPVVLSHWDWDRWSSGNKFAGAQHLTWIAPLQSVGAVHATFAAKISQHGQLLVWDPRWPTMTAGQVETRKCIGRGRNQSGLAIVVHDSANGPPILLPGDARYSALGMLPGAVTSIVAPHHGADMRNNFVPNAPNLPHQRVAYSYGLQNTYGHPTSVTQSLYDRAGWDHALLGKAQPVDRNTATFRNTVQARLGHIALGWSSLAPPIPYRASCSAILQPQQS